MSEIRRPPYPELRQIDWQHERVESIPGTYLSPTRTIPLVQESAPPDPLPADLATDVERLRVIAQAKASGLSWAQIAAVQGMPGGKAAKSQARRLARRASRALARLPGT